MKNLKHQSFGSSNENGVHRILHKTKNAAILATAILGAAAYSKADIPVQSNSYKTEYYDISQLNKHLAEKTKLKKELEKREKEERWKWDNIPDYQKLTTLFYASLIAIFLMNILTGKPDDRNTPSDKD